MAKLIKVQKSDEIVELIKKIKTLKGDEVVFDIPKGAYVFKNAHNFSLIKKSAHAMGKTVIIRTEDLAGQSIVAKAGLLLDDGDEEYKVQPTTKVKTKKVKFGDIGAQDLSRPSVATAIAIKSKPSLDKELDLDEQEANFMPKAPKASIFRLKSRFSKIFFLTAAILILIVFAVAVILPRADITVYARSEPISRDMEISVDTTTRTINGTRLTVPADSINRELSHTKNFPATGVKLVGTKAGGTVQLYNFTKNTLTLRAATTTLIIDGKKYNFTKDVTGLRPTARIGQGEEQEVDQSSLIPPVQVIAADVGSNYNISSNVRMELQNSALGQADVYGMTASALTGGSSTEIKILSQADLDKATIAMQDELAALAQSEIGKDGQSGIKVLPTAIKSEILAKTANKDVGAETNDFDMTIIARVTGLSFNEEDVKTLVLEKINSVLSADKYLLEDSKQELTATFKAVDIDNGTGVLAVHFETIAAYKVDNNNLSKILTGKSAIEIKEILLTKPEIDRVDVSFSPFFVNKAPRFNGKIYLNTVQSQ